MTIESEDAPVGSHNYISVQVETLPGKPPHARIVAMVGSDGKFINYDLAQYEGLIALMLEQLGVLQAATDKFKASTH